MFFDTHSHLNFQAFQKDLPNVIKRAHAQGVTRILIPGTDYVTSQRAIEIAGQYDNIYVAAGIHPHHVFDLYKKRKYRSDDLIQKELSAIESLLSDSHVVAVGEIGLDRHMYKETRYDDYVVNTEFISLQKEILKKQIYLALQHEKRLIFHNREATEDFLITLNDVWDDALRNRGVIHCCEPRKDILSFALDYDLFIGVDGDITYSDEKQSFIKEVPLTRLVIETDAPFLLPEPFRSRKEYPNEPRHVVTVAEWVAKVKGIPLHEVEHHTYENGLRLFAL